MNTVEPPPLPLTGLDPALAGECLRALLDALPSKVYFKDRESRFIAVSRSKARGHGVEPAAMVGRTDADFFSAESAQWRLVDEESIIATGEPITGKIEKQVRIDGAESWSETNKTPLRDPATGAVIGTFGVSHDVTAAQRALDDLEETRRKLIAASRLAGMAEVATGVLHNVGNVLTSLNVSANILATGLRYSKVESLRRVTVLLNEHAADLPHFLTADPKGSRIPEFIVSLSQHLADERAAMLNELTALQQNIDHIKEIVTMQQSYATMAGVVETLDPVILVEDALRMNAGALLRHSVSVVREFHPVAKVRVEKAKVLQILINLIRNAKYAVDDASCADKTITLRIVSGTSGRVQIVVQDNGIGIPPENPERIFQHGFTTRSAGHGFGLHSARVAAAAMDARLEVESAGLGLGATFTLDLPAEA